MTRAEYMEGLAKALKDYDEDFALDIIGDYRRHFDEAAADGRSEESVGEELGSVEDFIRDIPEEFKRDNSNSAKPCHERRLGELYTKDNVEKYMKEKEEMKEKLHALSLMREDRERSMEYER